MTMTMTMKFIRGLAGNEKASNSNCLLLLFVFTVLLYLYVSYSAPQMHTAAYLFK